MGEETMIDFNLRIKPEGVTPGTFSYHHYTNGKAEATILIKQVYCKDCGEEILGVDDFLHVLEHEYTEVVVCDLLREDGDDDLFHPQRFNKVFSPEHLIHKKHNCKKAAPACFVFG
jgi:hypothetical protein